MQVGQTQGIGNSALFAEIWKRDDDAVNPITVFLEQLGTAPRLFASFDRPVFALLRSQCYDVNARRPEHANDFFAATLGKVIGEEPAIPYDDTHGHFLG